jgi:uncharacterized RDD family membrane protein YckC
MAGTNIYGGFWIRLLAGIIDVIIVALVMGLVFALIIAIFPDAAPILRPPHHAINNMMNQGAGNYQYSFNMDDPYFIRSGIFLLYYAIMESSSMQATFGMKICGLKITDINGQRISFLRALGREIATYLSAIILLIGFFMIGWTQKKQGLHDMIASTLVVKK